MGICWVNRRLFSVLFHVPEARIRQSGWGKLPEMQSKQTKLKAALPPSWIFFSFQTGNFLYQIISLVYLIPPSIFCKILLESNKNRIGRIANSSDYNVTHCLSQCFSVSGRDLSLGGGTTWIRWLGPNGRWFHPRQTEDIVLMRQVSHALCKAKRSHRQVETCWKCLRAVLSLFAMGW